MRLEDFWSYVRQGQPDECWPWLRGCKGENGYGALCLKRQAARQTSQQGGVA